MLLKLKFNFEVVHFWDSEHLKDESFWCIYKALDKFGFSCSFGNNKVSLYKNLNMVGSGSLIDNLYMLDVVSSYNEILQTSSHGIKQKLNENLAIYGTSA